MHLVVRVKNKAKAYYLEKYISYGNSAKNVSVSLKGLKKEAIMQGIDDLVTKISLEKTKYAIKHYKLKVLSEIQILELERLKEIIDIIKKELPDTYYSYNKDDYVRFAQGSVSVEGNTISLQDTNLILEKGISISGHEVNEVKEIENLGKARIFLEKRKQFKESTLKKLHSIIVSGFQDKDPGKYRTGPIFITGTKVKTVPAENIKKEIKKLFDFYEKNVEKIYPLELAGIVHSWFEQIHPFKDGNGRVGRELLNFILLNNNFPRAVINLKNREKYIKALESCQINGDYSKFSLFLSDTLHEKLKTITELYSESKIPIVNNLINQSKKKHK